MSDQRTKETKNLHRLGLIIAIPAFAWFVYLTSWEIAIALLLVLFANNLSQAED